MDRFEGHNLSRIRNKHQSRNRARGNRSARTTHAISGMQATKEMGRWRRIDNLPLLESVEVTELFDSKPQTLPCNFKTPDELILIAEALRLARQQPKSASLEQTGS